MSDSFIVEVGGDPAAIRSAAGWLRHRAETASIEADRQSGDDMINAGSYWQGESASAFADISLDLTTAAREISHIAGPFAEIMHVFAGKVERTREFLSDGYIVVGDMGESIGDWFYDLSESVSHSG
ncbi:hypothetical protein [Microbacterium phyllosphaerae]|uniref:hypothetical protein n=1 Tax=Microbacterium phyllosphaerae TaxID=124798 RepID=UPI003D660F9F